MIRCRVSAEWLGLLGLLTLLAGPTPVRADGDAAAGRELFAQRCARCHAGGAGALRTAPAGLADLLRAGRVRQHRFALSDAELADLVAYLTEVKADAR